MVMKLPNKFHAKRFSPLPKMLDYDQPAAPTKAVGTRYGVVLLYLSVTVLCLTKLPRLDLPDMDGVSGHTLSAVLNVALGWALCLLMLYVVAKWFQAPKLLEVFPVDSGVSTFHRAGWP